VFIGIDCGTQGVKAAIWDGEDKLVGVGYKTYPLISDDSGKKEQEVDWWTKGLVSAMDEAFATSGVDRKLIQAIGISGQQHGLVLLDKNNQVLRPAKLWCDTETTDDLNHFVESHQIDFAATIGINVPVAFTIAKLVWVKNHEPEVFERTSKVMLPHDYLNYWFTGNYVTEAGDASGSGFLDTNTKQWSSSVLDLIEMPDSFQLPELISSETPHGTIRPELAEQLGLSKTVVLSSGGGDNMMAAIGTGNVNEGLLTMSLGTSGTVYSHTQRQIASQSYPDLNAFCSSSNGYLPLASTMNVTSATTAFRDLLSCDIPHFENLISNVAIGSEGISLMPYLAGARLPNVPKAKGAIFGLTADNMRQETLLRSAVEGVTFNLAKGVEVLSETGLDFTSVTLIGGGSNSATWRQMLADVTGLVVNVPTSHEAAALGAAMQAKWAYCIENNISTSIQEICNQGISMNEAMTAEPRQREHALYQDIYQEYHELVQNYVKQYR